MDIGIEDGWQGELASPLPRLSEKYDTKVFDTERLAIFWGAPQDLILLRKEPPREWIEYLKANGMSVPSFLSIDCETALLGQQHLNALLPHLAQRASSPKVLPYAATDAAWEFCSRANADLVGCPAGFMKQWSSKAVQRELLVAAGIPTPEFEVFESYEQLALRLAELVYCQRKTYVLKSPYGASGQGMFVLDTLQKMQYLQRKLEQGRAAGRNAAVILEQWHQVKSHVSYQLALQRDGAVTFDFVREQILNGGVFRGLRYPADLNSDELNQLRDLGIQVGKALARKGAAGIINVDAIVTLDGIVYPAIDINLRFSLATYFHRYVEQCSSLRYIKVCYFDIPRIVSVARILRVTQDLVRGESMKVIVASVSDLCAKGLRRVFLLCEADNQSGADELEQQWLAAATS